MKDPFEELSFVISHEFNLASSYENAKAKRGQ